MTNLYPFRDVLVKGGLIVKEILCIMHGTKALQTNKSYKEKIEFSTKT